MKVLVTGASGFLGSALVRRLVSEGEEVRALVRSAEKGVPLAVLGAEPVVGEITDRALLTGAMDGVSAVYHLAGRLFAPGVPASEYYRTHVEGTRTLLECCADTAIERFVHCSTTGVLGVTGESPADEERSPAPTNPYEDTKWQAEQLVRAETQRGLPAAVVRPGLVYGPGDLHLVGFFRSIQRGLFRPIGNEPVWLHPIYIEDLVEAMWRCSGDPRAIGQVFHVSGVEPVTLAFLASTIADSLGRNLPGGTIPLALARALAAAGDLLPTRVRPLAPLKKSRLEFLTNSRAYSVRKAERLLGFVAQTDLGHGIARTVSWYRDNGYLPAAPRRAALRRAA